MGNDSILHELVSIFDILAKPTAPIGTFTSFWQARSRLYELSNSDLEPRLLEHLRCSDILARSLPTIRSNLMAAAFEEEVCIGNSFLKAGKTEYTDLLGQFYGDIYLDQVDCDLEVQREQGFPKCAEWEINFIGTGPVPLSLVIMAKSHGVKVVGIEMNQRAAYIANQIVERLSLANSIKIICDAREINNALRTGKSFILANCLMNLEVLAKTLATRTEKLNVVARLPRSDKLAALVDQEIDISIFERQGFIAFGETKTKDSLTLRSQLYVKPVDS